MHQQVLPDRGSKRFVAELEVGERIDTDFLLQRCELRTGRTGNATAVHLHYEIMVSGRAYNPLTVGD